ncbi:MAG TPA: glutamate formimidoyltransferase [Thermoplasmata archaeon]|nr:glutamate formimidoyltransferase [Thermoplasmata archaeon]
MKLFESVPNFSEGRDPAKVEAIARSARSVPGVRVLDVERNADHHRSVITVAGEGEPLLEALFRMARTAVETLDLTKHAGEHPRMGVVDVVPIVPFDEATVPEAIALSERLARRIWTELGVPVYLYAQSARRPERADLAVVRRGGFEAIRDEIADHPERAPDFGEPRVHPTAGIVAVGARPVLIAYNVDLATDDVALAKRIAHEVRARDGGLPEVKALGFDLAERHQAQVSMNLTDFRVTPISTAFDAVRSAAARAGVEVARSEIVGLVPEDALLEAAEHYLRLQGFDRRQILERRLREGEGPVGAARADPLAAGSVREFAERLSAKTPTPGGGSASAVAGTLGAALGEMVLRYSRLPGPADPEVDEALATLGTARARFLELVDEDARSYETVRATKKARKAAADDALARQAHRAAVRTAAEVPLETAGLARSVSDLLDRLRPRAKPALLSDLETALALLLAARTGAAANVRINLSDLSAEGIDTRGLADRLAEHLRAEP